MSNRIFSIWMVLMIASGAVLAYLLGSLQKLELFKVLNIVGIIYGLVGVVILSEFVIKNEKWSRFVVEKLSDLMIWAHGTIPFGVTITSLVLFLVARDQFPSSETIGGSFMLFTFYSLVPTFWVEDYVFGPKSPRTKDPILRTRIFGLFLVITGMVVQLVAAIQDVLGN